MKKLSNFKFDVWLSRKGYQQKPTTIDYRGMSWEQRTVSLSDFIANIRCGHSYCHIYYGRKRLKSKFKHSHVISIDVDDAAVPMEQFVANCQLKPTFTYETFSNSPELGIYRYRVVYIIKEALNAAAFGEMYDKISRMIGLENTKDKCGKVPSQVMNGTNSDAKVFRSDIIYSAVDDLPVESYKCDNNSDALFDKTTFTSPSNNSVSVVSSPYINNIHSITSKQYKSKEPLWTFFKDDDYEPLTRLQESREDFLRYYGQHYSLTRWSKLSYNEHGYCIIPDDHLSLFVRYARKKGCCVVDRFRDGEKRRIRLYTDGCIIRKIKPDIGFVEMLYNLVHRVEHYYDNSDGVLSDNLLVQKTHDVMTADVDSMDFNSLDAGRITTSPGYCRENGLSRQRYSRTAMKLVNYDSIDAWYNREESVTTNL